MAATSKILTVQTTSEGDWQRIRFAGPLTEDAKAVLAPFATSAGLRCILDMSGVTYLNSIGIRDWSYFLKALRTNRELTYENVPHEVVRTMNMVTNFQGRLPVKSVIRDYGCPSCGHEQHEQFFVDKDYKRGELPNTAPRKCGQCGVESEAFEPDDVFFQFLLGA